MQKTIFPYIRFSSIEQQKGDSLRRQLSAIRKYAEANGYSLNESLELQDLGLSAYTGSNHRAADSGLGRFLAAIEEGAIPTDGSSYLCVEQLDRLSREKVLDALDLFKRILSKNVNIITLMDGRVYTKKSLNDFMAIMYSLMVMHQAYLESEKKSERVKAAFQGRLDKIKKGGKAKYSSAIPNWLYETEPKSGKFKTNEHVKTIKRIFKMVLDGISLNEIARILNTENVPRITKNKYKNATGIWSGSVISHIVKNRCVIGCLDLYDTIPTAEGKKPVKTLIETIEGYYPQIISETDFILANEIVKERRLTQEKGRNSNDNLFSTLMFCGDCLQRIHFETDVKQLKTGVKKYKCLKCTSKRFKKGCVAQTIRYEPFEEQFPKFYKLGKSFFRKTYKEAIITAKERESKAEAEIIKLTNKIYELNEEILNNPDINPAHFVRTISNLENKLAEAKKERKEASSLFYSLSSDEDDVKLDLYKESDRVKYKRFLKAQLACIIIYTREQYAWIIMKNGSTHAFRFGDYNIGSRMDDFIGFMEDMQNKIKNNETIDPYFYRIEKTIRNMQRAG